MTPRTPVAAIFLAAFALTTMLVARPVSPARAASSAPCSAPGFKTLNFFLGNWLVMSNDGSGTILGYDTLIHALGDCGFYEYWRDASNTHRAFASFGYQPGAESWHFNWLGDDGMEANFDGSRTKTAALSMSGVDYMGPHRRLHHVEWIVNPDGTLQKIWKSSHDEGRTWTVVFDGIYYRAKVGGSAFIKSAANSATPAPVASAIQPRVRIAPFVNTYDTPLPSPSANVTTPITATSAVPNVGPTPSP